MMPRSADRLVHMPGWTMVNSETSSAESLSATRPSYKVYKRRFWGLAQLVLLNIVVSWDVCDVPESRL